MTVIDPKPPPEMTQERVFELYQQLRSAMGTWIMGMHKTHDLLAKAAFMRILYTDKITRTRVFGQPPIMLLGGTGKGKTDTMTALSMALKATHNRIQGNPDMRPHDILGGLEIIEGLDSRRRIAFVPGSIFCHIFLADEANRMTTKTKSALLEAMEERSVTPVNKNVDLGAAGIQYRKALPLYPLSENPDDTHGPRFFWPFFCQNPFGEEEGTYPTTQAEWDRMTLCIRMERPSFEDELLIDDSVLAGKRIDPVTDLHELLAAGQFIREQVTFSKRARWYQNMLVRNTDPDPDLQSEKPTPAIAEFVATNIEQEKGASPRVEYHMTGAAIVWAYFCGSNVVLPEHVRAIAPYVIPHRLGLTDKARYANKLKQHEVFAEVLAATPIPKWKE